MSGAQHLLTGALLGASILIIGLGFIVAEADVVPVERRGAFRSAVVALVCLVTFLWITL